MGNTERGEIEIDIGGKQYTARFTYDAIMAIEAYFGTPQEPKAFKEIFKRHGKEMPLSMIPIMLWATLRGGYPQEFPNPTSLAARLDMSKSAYYAAKMKDVFEVAKQAMQEDATTARPFPGGNGAVARAEPVSTGESFSAPQV